MKKWLIGFDQNGLNRCGSDYAQTTTLKQRAALIRHAEQMKRAAFSMVSVYLINECQWTQSACEMSPKDFSDYVKKIGTRII